MGVNPSDLLKNFTKFDVSENERMSVITPIVWSV